MISPFFLKKMKFKFWMSCAGALLVSGCALVPGQYLGVTPTINETDKDYVYDASDVQSVEERADVFSINPTTIAEQIQKRQEVDAQIKAHQSSFRQSPSTEYRVGAQDVLLITVWNHPEINNPAGSMNAALTGRVVNEDGSFFFPYVGRVPAVGKTVADIQAALVKSLTKVLVDPQVDVSVLHYRSKRAYILGQVEKPGVVPLTDVPMTIADLISAAGGLKPEANLNSATLMRDNKTQTIDLYGFYYKGDISQNILLRAGDVVTIPENRYNKVFVLGEVGKPQSLVMPRGRFSLAEAISDVGGFDPLSANAGQLYVIRMGQNERPQIWHLNAASPDALMLADQFELEPRDIVYVDPAAVARFSRVLRNILPTATVARPYIQN
ncbi:polysaccharide biosynthesis/export family protein [Pigmentiphaga kullae]|nr:polysaccharide biosynthesis/export family protein [Pigmentiphaga kullae]